jgi:hypothetical protein
VNGQPKDPDEESKEGSKGTPSENSEGSNGASKSSKSGQNRTRIPDKERARKARQRKKKYYEDLEKRVDYLEQKCKKLSDELDYCRHKLSLYEYGPQGSEESKSGTSLFNKVEGYLSKSNADDEKLRQFMTGLTRKYGAFGQEKLRIVENSFDMLIENMLSGSSLKLVLYVADQERPADLKGYEKFKNMKKFEQFEKVPDEITRTVLLNESEIFQDEVSLQNYLQNQIAINKRIKQKLEEGILKILEAKETIYEGLVQYDAVLNHHRFDLYGKEMLLKV